MLNRYNFASSSFEFSTFLSSRNAKKIACSPHFHLLHLSGVILQDYIAKKMFGTLDLFTSKMEVIGRPMGRHSKGKITKAHMKWSDTIAMPLVTMLGMLRQCRIMCEPFLYHSKSTADVPQHYHCPEGAESWCFYQRPTAFG